MALENEYDFSGYEPTTYQSGWTLTIVTVIICILVNLMLPIMVRVGAACDERKKLNTADADGEEEVDFQAAKTSALVQPVLTPVASPPASSVLNPYNIAMRTGGDGGKGFSGTPSLVSSAVRSTASVRSSASTSSFSHAASAILERRPHKGGRYRRRRHRNNPESSPTAKQPGSVDMDDVSVSSACSKSVMSNLDHDAVSVQDAIDAHDGGAVLLEKDEPPSSLWGQFLDIVDWETESKRLAKLTIPFTIQGCSEGVFQIVNVSVIGHFVGVMEANAYVVVTILVEFSATLTYGFAEAVGTLVPQADGAGNNLLVGRYLQLSIILYTIVSIPGCVVWTMWTEPAVLWFGFDEETAALAQEYAYAFMFMAFSSGFDHAVVEFLDAMGHEKYGTIFTVLRNAIDTVSVVVAVTLGIHDLFYIGVIQAALLVPISLANLAFVIRRGWLDDYWEGFAKTLSLRDGRAVHTMMITAIPSSIAYLLTYGEWEVLTIFASAMGPAEVAAWGILGFVWDTFERLTAGFADAAEVRVGFRMGAGQPHSAKMAAYKAIYLGGIVSVINTSILFIVSVYVPGWLTPDPTLQRMIFDCLPLMGFGQILLLVGTTSWGILGAQGRVRLATTVEFVSSWVIAIPLCALSLYVLNYDIVGFVAALVFSYTVGGCILGYVILRSDWGALSQTVISRNAIEGVTWEDNDWEELPPHVQKAAEVLGYNANMWNNDLEPPCSDKDWAELTRQEREAAQIIGFNKNGWDKEHDTSAEDSTKDGKSKFDNMNWKDLPADVRKAAQKLGYNKKMWDSDKDPASCDRNWDELNPTEQEAALTLGYSQKSWDGDSDSEEPTHEAVNYDDLDWKELPQDVQAAAKVLGYNENMWNNDASPPSEDKHWHKLTDQEQAAARTLGYTEKTWSDSSSDSSVSECAAPNANKEECGWKELPFSGAAAEQDAEARRGTTEGYWDNDLGNGKWQDFPGVVQSAASVLGCNDVLLDNDVVMKHGMSAEDSTNDGKSEFDDMDWKELPVDVRKAAQTLGYSKKMWDSGKDPASCDRDWDELNPTEQEAARTLGYKQESWDDTDASPASKRTSTQPDFSSMKREDLPRENANVEDSSATDGKSKFDDMDWKELPVDVRKAAQTLGYSKKMWDSGKDPASCDRDWDELNPTEQEAARTLGYNQKSWDHNDAPPPSKPTSTQRDFSSIKWEDLPREIQSAAAVLGYNEILWDSDGAPASEEKDWHQLTNEERRAAKKIGFNEKRWNSE